MFQGVMCRTLEGHAHWVNTLALSTDYVLRTQAIVTSSDKVQAFDSKYSIIKICNNILLSGT